MTSKINMSFDKGRAAMTRLPHISKTRSLVSPASSARTPNYRDLAEDWASSLRQRLMQKIQEQNEIDENEIRLLKEEIKALFITALQRDNRHTWLYLKECVIQLTPLSHLVQGEPDIVHYLRRLKHHLSINNERLFELQIDKTINDVFAKDIKIIEKTEASPVRSYSIPTPASSAGTPVHKQPPKLTLPDGKNPYVLERPEDHAEIKPRPLTFGDLRQSLPNVALEMATREAIWNACLGTTAIALNIDLPECLEDDDEEGEEEEGTMATDHSEYISESCFEDLDMEESVKQIHPVTPMSGREAVQYFTKCYHLGKIKFMYFNMAPNRRYMPYDLVATTKAEVQPEHFIFSTFGVLHVFPRQPSENLSLAAWQREAVIFSTIIKIPFFKYYLLRRMFARWRANVHFKEFSTIRHQISEGLLQAVPSFGAALLHISKLCHELLHLTFLPTDTTKCYELGDFKNVVNYMNMQAEKILERFFRYNKVIVDTTAEESFKKLRHCEEQYQHKPLFSKDSLTLQKAKRRQRAMNLARAREETKRLGNFVKLVDQMLLAHLVQLARVSVTKFVYESMAKGAEAPREALFRAKLIFNEENELTISPAKEHFISMLSETFDEIPHMLCQAALPLDGALNKVDDGIATEAVSNAGAEKMLAPNRHQSMATLMRDPKKQNIESLRNDMAAAATTIISQNSTGVSQGSSRKLPSPKGSIIHTPDITTEALPTKGEDEMGQATPELIITARQEHELAITGRGFVGQYTPLTHGNLAEKLTQDADYKKAITTEQTMMQAALDEISEFCEKLSWLNEIYTYCTTWTEDSVKEWKGVQAFNIEQRLTELRLWSDRVRNLDHTYVTDNGIFLLHCSGIQDFLLKKLDDIFNELCMFVADEASNLAKEFSDELVSIVENMKQKNTDIAGFAVYAKNVSQYKKNTVTYQQRIEYIKSLFEVIRMSYRQLTPEEEKLEESVMTHWEEFLFLMQDAMDFVNTQTPLITQNLEDRVMQSYGSQSATSSASTPLRLTKLSSSGNNQRSRQAVDSGHRSTAHSSAVSSVDGAGQGNRDLQKLEEQARALCDAATSGIFLDPTQKPSHILMEMRHLRDSFYDIQKQLEQGSKWREAIIGEPCDLTFLHEMSSRMTVRQQLWRYVEVSQHAITEWKHMLFVKFNCHKAMDKILEWQATGQQLKEHIPQDDAVLIYWLQILEEFKHELPLLNKLGSEALKPRHWRTIFLGIGEQYNPDVQLTVDDLLSYNLRAHVDVINHVYKAAITEYSIEHRLANISKFWNEREFKLAKHIPDSVYKKEETRARSARSGTSNRKLRRMDKFRQERAERSAPKGLMIDQDNLYVLIEVEELKYLLEDSCVQVQTMLTSPYVADHKAQVQKWSEVLGQAEEIIDLWISCQKKWLYLLKVFDNVDFFMKMPDLGQKFEVVHNKFMDIVCAAMHDPKVISIVNHARNEKGYRLQQGDRARDTLLAIIEEQEVILKHLNTRIDAVRSLFPRLHFLSSTEIVELLAISRNPRALQASAKKCFHGIDSLTYMLPNSSVMVDTSLDVELNAYKLEVTEIQGILGEALPLYTRLEAYPSATKWLSTLELHMKTTLQIVLEACVQAQLDDGSKQPIQLLEELSKYEQLPPRSEAEELKKDIKESFSHWILRFPAQCVLTADAILWERSVLKCLKEQDAKELKLIRTKLQSRIDQYVKVLRENSVMSLPEQMRTRIKLVLEALIIQGLHQRDNLDTLLANSSLSDGAFDWLRILKHHMDIRTVLRAVTDVSQSAESTVPEKSSIGQRSSTNDKEQSLDFGLTPVKRGTEDPNRLQRGKTTVCTGYQFGPCIVSQMGAGFAYDHEYLGPTARLVVTPLTERATLSLTMSLRAFHSGTLIGPPGTGKTDTIKDLAKSLGRHLVSVTCSSDLTLPIMNQYLNGMIQSGSWVLFDDVDRMSKGLMSVFAQQLEYIGSALRVLDVSCDNQYGIRGQPRFDKNETTKLSEKKIRRNSLTTLHSLPADADGMALNRQATVPHGFKECGLVTYFEETWIGERERRHSIEKEIEIKESELYKSMKPPPLFYEHVTLHLKPKQDFSDLASQNLPYKRHYLGNIMFCGKLVRASANFGCFMTMNTTSHQCCDIPDNIRMCMRPCAMVLPNVKVIIETKLYCYGYNRHQVLASKLALFMELLKKQLPSREQYDFGLSTVITVLHLACEKFTKLQLDIAEAVRQTSDGDTAADLPDLIQGEEASLILAISLVLGPKMSNAEDTSRFRLLLRDVFPQSSRPKSGSQNYNPELVNAIQEQLLQDGLQTSQQFVNKILSLYSALKLKQGVILVGSSGSGKTTIYHTLYRAVNTLSNKDSDVIMADSILQEKDSQCSITRPSKINNKPKDDRRDREKSKKKNGLHAVASLWESLAKEDKFISSKVDLQVIYSNAMECQQLFGYYQDGIWKPGLFTSLLFNAHLQAESAKTFMSTFDERKFKIPIQQPKKIHKWFVLDGALHSEWVDNMASLLDREERLTLANQQKIPLPDVTSLIFEVTDLTNASPSMISRCVVVHCDEDTVSWKYLIQSWLINAKEKWIINTASIQVLNSLMSSVFPVTLDFLQSDCCTSLLANVSANVRRAHQVAPGIQEVTSFLRFFTAFMNENFLRESWEKKLQVDVKITENKDSSPGQRSARQSGIIRIEEVLPNYMTIIKGMFAFSYIWGFGGDLHDRYKQRFSQFAYETLSRASQSITLPDNTSVYDIYFDVKQGIFNKWADKQMEKCRSFASHYTVTPEIDCYYTLVDMLLKNRQPVLLVGEPGVGKTSLVSNLIQVQHQYTRIVMSPVMTAASLQQTLVAKMLDLKSRTVDPIYSNANIKSRCLFFVDDLNTAHANPETGVQGALELLRELLTQKTIYEPNRHVLVPFQDADLLATATNPGVPGTGCGYSSHVMSSRLTRLFTTVTFFSPDDVMLHGLYTRTVHSWLEEFPTRAVQHHMEFAKALVQASIDVYKIVKDRLRPSPINPHYVFSLCDIAHHIQGILLMSPRSKTKLFARAKKHVDQRHRRFDGSQSGTESLASELSSVLPEQMRSVARLWCHESTRVYGDRIIGEDEQNWFENVLEDVVIKNFCTGSDDWQEKMSTITEVLSQGEHPTSSEMSGSVPSATPSAGDVNNQDIAEETDAMDQSVRTKSRDQQDKPGSSESSRSGSTVMAKPPTPPISHAKTEPRQEQSQAAAKSPGQTVTTCSSRSTTATSKENHSMDSTTSSRTSHLSREKSKTEASSYDDEFDDTDDEEEDSSCSSSTSSEDETDSETMTSTDAASRSQESPNHQIIYPDTADKHQQFIKDTKQVANDGHQMAGHDIALKPKDELVPDGSSSSSKLSYGRQVTMLRKGGKAANKRGVTFKAGLIADMIEETYTGPLMSLDQIKETDERLTEFIFCKHIVPMHAEAFSMQAERGYTEYLEEQLSEALYTCLALYNKATSQRIDLVFFREAVQHAARLSRVLAMPGGHALLLSQAHSTGRATLVRLAAFFTRCKLFEPNLDPDSDNHMTVVRDQIKECSKVAAIQGKQVVLLIRDQLHGGGLDNICAFIKEGMYPGLYTPDEIQTIAQQMTPGQVKTTRLDKIEAAFNKFIRRVQQNLHVIVCLSYTGTSMTNQQHSLYVMLQKYSMLTTHCCHIDVYHPWTYEAYMSVAEYWLRDPNSKIAVPWNEHSKTEQMYLVAMAMSYIHQSSMAAVEKLYSHQRTSYNFFSPLTFTEFIHIFKVIASHIAKKERSKIFKNESSLGKVNEAYDSIASYKREVSNLFPRHQKALAKVKEHVECVEVQREQYKQALDTCKEEEHRIECMLSPLEALRAEAQIEFDKVNPTYHAALSALKSLEKAAVEEIKTYRIPPKMVSFVLEAVCLLFREPQNWETAKGLLIRDTFFHELEFYDKDNIPDDIYEKLGQFYHHPDFNVDTVKATSSAVSHLCWWVRSVYEYATICRTMRPRLQMLQDAEQKLNKAQAILGTKRVEANRIKSALESRIQAHSEAVKQVKTIEKEIQSIERKIAKATNIMDNMQMQYTLWRSELRMAKSKIRTAPGDALIAAAIVCYHGPLDNRTRAELMHDWLNRCEMTNFDPTLKLGRQVKPVSLSAKMENFMRPQTYSITDSVHSIQQVELYQAEIASHRGDDVSSIHETERASSASSMPQLSLYRHQPSVYDTGIGFKTEIRVLDNIDTSIHGNPELESIDASSISSRNLLSVRENYTLQDVLSDYRELSEWKLKSLPSDVHSIHNALIMKVCCINRKHCWPLLIDPDQQAELWVRTILQGSALLVGDQDNTDRMTEAQMLSGCHSYEPHSDSARSRVTDESVNSAMTDDSTTISARTDTDSHGRHNRQSVMSVNTLTEYYNGVSSTQTTTTESIRSKIAQSIERPDDNLWIVASDNPDLEAKLINAVIHGVSLLITHTERKPLDPLFHPLMFKQFAVDTNGQQVIRIGDVQLACHPNFALFFSSSVPLFLEGDGIYKLLVQKMCPIDFSLSQELIIDTVLSEILKADRPEFDAQRRSMDRDIIHHQREIDLHQTAIMKKTLGLECAILEDKTMLESLIECQKQVNMHKSALEESQYLREILEEKRAHLIAVATHGAKIYEIIQRISVLNPLYHVTLSQFMTVITDTIQHQHRGKGSNGAPKARAQELISAITSSMYNFVSMMLFESDLKLFALLITLERLRMSQQLTNQELGLFVNGFESSELEDNIMFDDKPAWLSNKVWLDCAGLETTVDAFHQLRQSLTKHSKEWQEYFTCPVVLLSDLPGTELVDLTIFQKCLLWRICCPQKMVDICDALVLHELGGLVEGAKNYSVSEAYRHSDSATPVIFMLPNVSCQQWTEEPHTGFSFANPTRQIHQFARECGMDGKVHVITCGTEIQLSEIQHALHECLTDGYWLIIQNAHLSGRWNRQLLELIRTIVFSKKAHVKEVPLTEDGTPDEELSVTSEDNEDTVSIVTEQNDGPVHKNFRLWITTRSDQGHLIPGLLIQYGIKVTCEQVQNIRETLKHIYITTEAMLMADNLNRNISKIFGDVSMSTLLAILYSVITHRRCYGRGSYSQNYFWSEVDLSLIVDQFKIIARLCQRPRGFSDITELIFGGHCVDPEDQKIIEALVSAIIRDPDQLKQLTAESPGVASLLSYLLGGGADTFDERVNSLVDIDGRMLSLPFTAEKELLQSSSRRLLSDLVRVIGAPELISVPLELSNRKAESVLQEVFLSLETFPELPQTNPDAFYPIELFLHQEVLITKSLIGQLRADVMHLLSAVRGQVCATREHQMALLMISHQKVPHSWYKETFPSCISLTKWVSLLSKRIGLVSAYIKAIGEGQGPVTFDLGAFHRPNRFFDAILQNYVRREFKDLQRSDLDIQFLPVGVCPTSPPSSGAYISGLRLYNADWCPSSQALREGGSEDRPVRMPVVWLKPTDKAALDKQRKEAGYELYSCPVYSSPSSCCLSSENIVTKLRLPTFAEPRIWTERRTFLSCQLNN